MPILNQLISSQSFPSGIWCCLDNTIIYITVWSDDFQTMAIIFTSILSDDIGFNILSLLLCLEAGVSKWTTHWSGMKKPSYIFIWLSSLVGWDMFLSVTFLGTSFYFWMSFHFCACTSLVWTFCTHLFFDISPFLGVSPLFGGSPLCRVALKTSIVFCYIE